MAKTEILFYIVVVAVVIVKLIFWIVYICVRKRRARSRGAQPLDTCYEEQPAVPQPAYVFSGMSPEDIRHAVLIDSLPGYQMDDPFKIDTPPPAYATDNNVNNDSQSDSTSSNTGNRRRSLSDIISTIDVSETANLVNNEEDVICLQQIT